MSLPANFRETAIERYQEARRFWNNWRGDARDNYAFISGKQWLDSDIRILEAQKRPPITFNYSEKMIDAVVGAEVSNRQEITYAPRDLSDAPLAEIWTNAVKWVRDEANIEDEETDAFRDALICGLGWTHTRVSFEEDSDGKIESHRIDPLEVIADPSAVKPGLTDRRYSFRELWVDEREVNKLWPRAAQLGTDANLDGPSGLGVIRTGDRYRDDDPDDPDIHKGQIKLLHYECVELEPMYRVVIGDQTKDVPPAVFNALPDKDNLQYVKMNKRVYYYAYFAGETLLESGLSPTQVGFTYQCITGKRDRNKNTWYGLTRVMKDPQRWANKWLSQILHIINSNAKGGLLAEVNAFVDPKRAQDEWAMPESITMLKEGGINKIKEKQMTSYPSGLDRLMEFALASLPQVTGINLEALGLAGREQANVLEQSRKQAAYGLLAPVFDSLRRYRKMQGRIILDFINNYISDGRMIRIGGPESQQFIQLTKVPDAVKYDIIVDQSPTAPDVKRETWNVLENLIPAAMKAGLPIPPSVLKYAPIPTMLAMEWEQHLQQQQTSPEQIKQMQQEMQKLGQENMKMKQALQDKSQEHQLDIQKMVAEHKLAVEKLTQEFQLKQVELQANIALKREAQQQELEIRRAEAENEIDTRVTESINTAHNETTVAISQAVSQLLESIGKLQAEDEADKD